MTTLIIAALFVLFVLGIIIPQKQLFLSREQYERWQAANPFIAPVVETLRLNDIYVAPVTVFFFVLFFANLSVVIIHRVPVVLRRSYLSGRAGIGEDIAGIRHAVAVRSFTLRYDDVHAGDRENARVEDIRREIAGFLRKRLWSIIDTADTRSLLAVKNRYSPFGFLFFHVSFFLCLIGGLLITYTRFSGNLLLTVGEEFHSDMSRFRRIIKSPKIFEGLPPLGIVVEEVRATYEGAVSTDLHVKMRLKYWNDDENVVMRINEPINKGPVSILASNIGVSPLFVLRGSDGREISGGFFSLNVLKGQEDSFEFPSMPYMFSVLFYPDFAVEKGKEYSRSPELKNPVVHMKIKKDGNVIREGNIGLKQAISFDGLQVSFEDIRYWVDFLIVREYGATIVFVGFFLGTVGLVMRLVFYQKEVKMYVEGTDGQFTVYVSGRSEYYIHSFREELDSFVSALQEMLTMSVTNPEPKEIKNVRN